MVKGYPHILLGGTFDPVHFGHLRMAQEVLNQFPLADVFLMPAAYPAHRSEPGATSLQRIDMLKIALLGQHKLKLDCRELKRQEPSYSVVTLKQIRQEIGERSLIFVMGTDAFAKLDKWYQWQEMLRLTNILVVGRPSAELPQSGPVAKVFEENKLDKVESLAEYACGKIAYYEMPQLDISSTYIREQIKCGFSPRFLLPDVILDYINENSLYCKDLKHEGIKDN